MFIFAGVQIKYDWGNNMNNFRLSFSRYLICFVYFVFGFIIFFMVCPKVYAREGVSFSHTYNARYIKVNGSSGSISLLGSIRCVLTYDDLVNYLGIAPGDSLTFTVNSFTVNSYSNNSSGGNTTFYPNAFDSDWGYIYFTPSGGGDEQTITFKIGEPVSISYSGGNITLDIYPPVYSGATNTSYKYLDYTVNSTWSFTFPPAPRSDNEALNDLVDNQEQYRQEDRDDATQAGSDAANLVTEMETLKDKWAILWYPIEFTQTLLSVFGSGTGSANYISKYYNVTGFSYDEESGFLVPIRDPVMTIASASSETGGASITFPAFTLPVLNVQIWDSYTFDLTIIKDSFPVLFDALYVIISCLEVYWFVSFLKSKFDEVFG